jgi:SMI1 / KNR4 family (SUKH-1)
MDPVEAIRRAQATTLVDEDGHEVVLGLAPPLPPEELERLEVELGVPLPRELRTLLEHTSGLDGVLDAIDFTGRRLDLEAGDLLPSGLPVAHDGYGNFWMLDLTPDERDAAPVFFASHDPPVLVYQSPGLGHFLHEAFRMYVPPHHSLVDDVHEGRLFAAAPTLDQTAAAAADEDLRAFAVELGEGWTFVDLREPEVGLGFTWGRYGPRTEVRRHGYERLFALSRPEQKPGFLARLRGATRPAR